MYLLLALNALAPACKGELIVADILVASYLHSLTHSEPAPMTQRPFCFNYHYLCAAADLDCVVLFQQLPLFTSRHIYKLRVLMNHCSTLTYTTMLYQSLRLIFVQSLLTWLTLLRIFVNSPTVNTQRVHPRSNPSFVLLLMLLLGVTKMPLPKKSIYAVS